MHYISCIWRWLFIWICFHVLMKHDSSSWHILTSSAEMQQKLLNALNTNSNASQNYVKYSENIVITIPGPFHSEEAKEKNNNNNMHIVKHNPRLDLFPRNFSISFIQFFEYCTILPVSTTQPTDITFSLFQSKTMYFFNILNIPKALFKSFGS